MSEDAVYESGLCTLLAVFAVLSAFIGCTIGTIYAFYYPTRRGQWLQAFAQTMGVALGTSVASFLVITCWPVFLTATFVFTSVHLFQYCFQDKMVVTNPQEPHIDA